MAEPAPPIGKRWEPVTYEVGREKIREYAHAVGETDPIHFDHAAAREAGFRAVVAPPMFAVVYSAPAVGPAVLDPELGIDYARLVHGSQRFEWGEPVCAGDVVQTSAELTDVTEKGSMTLYELTSTSTNHYGEQVVRGVWTNIVRGE